MSKDKIRIYRMDVGSCNGCDVEVFSILSTRFDMCRLNAEIVDNPEDSNIMIVTGVPTIKTKNELKRVYEDIRKPKIVIAMGTCAINRGIFKDSYTANVNVDDIIPVDAYAFGCPPDPLIIYNALGDILGKTLDINWEVSSEFRGLPKINHEKCTGCGACIKICPSEAINSDERDKGKIIKFRHEDCIYCSACELNCPEDAIELESNRMQTMDDKYRSRSSAEIEMQKCVICSESFATRRLINRSLERILDKVPEYEKLKNSISEGMRICLNCRSMNSQIRKSKSSLLELAENLK